MKQAVLDAKISVVKEIQEKLTNAQSSVVVEYRGLTVAEVTELRRLLRAENVEFKVYKNSMLARAVEAAGFDELNEQMTGPNAIAFSDDAVAPSRVLAKFAKKHESLILKGAVVEGKVVGVDTIAELSSLPSRDGLLSMLLSCLQSPVRSFACVVKAVADSQGEALAETEVEAAVEAAVVAEVVEEIVAEEVATASAIVETVVVAEAVEAAVEVALEVTVEAGTEEVVAAVVEETEEPVSTEAAGE